VLRPSDVDRLQCPETGEPLVWRGDTRQGRLWSGELISGWTSVRWPVRRGRVVLYRDHEIGDTDRFMRRIYNSGAALHDPLVRLGLPFFQLGGTEHSLREFLVERMELDQLRPRDSGEPIRILEVSLGTGANMPYVRRALPGGLAVEWWGIDLSRSMLGRGAARLRRMGLDARLLLADAHHLPFADHQFDRVFHVGGINAFHDPAQALREMARVARPDTPIVVVDEQLRDGVRDPWRRAMFALVTFYDDDPRSPVHLLPEQASHVRDEQPSDFFYCLSFRSPGRSA